MLQATPWWSANKQGSLSTIGTSRATHESASVADGWDVQRHTAYPFGEPPCVLGSVLFFVGCEVMWKFHEIPIFVDGIIQWFIYIHRIYGSLVRDPKKTHLYLGGGNSNIFIFQPYLGKIPILTNIFQLGWNHQPVIFCSANLLHPWEGSSLAGKTLATSSILPGGSATGWCWSCSTLDSQSSRVTKCP